MAPIIVCFIAFGLALVGILLGSVMQSKLPEGHLSSDSKEVVKLSMGVVATLAALVLGLLVASAKGTYDARESEINQITAYVILLDNLLAKYGDEAQAARASLRQATPRMVDRIWREGQMMGGAKKILARGRELHDEGKYLLASEILNKLVQAEPQNQTAKDLLADVFEQLGYQQENPGLRNSFLAAAYELRSGIPQGETADSSSPDVIRAMSTELFLNFLGIRMDSRKAEGMRFTINLVTPDNGEKFLVELENATLTNIKGFVADKPDLTLTINRSDLEQTMTGAKTLDAQIADGTAKVEGDASILKQLASTMVDFDARFEIMPGTKAKAGEVAHADPYEAVPRQTIAE